MTFNVAKRDVWHVVDVVSACDLWHIVAGAREHRYVVGASRDASVTAFNPADRNEYFEYTTKDVCSLMI